MLSVFGSADRDEFRRYPGKEAMHEAFADTRDLAVEASKACRGKVEVRPFQRAASFQSLLEP